MSIAFRTRSSIVTDVLTLILPIIPPKANAARPSGHRSNPPTSTGLDERRPQADGFLLLSPKAIEQDFAQDLTASEKALLVAVQRQAAGAIFEAKPTAVAWRNKSSWYVVSANDRMIAPEPAYMLVRPDGSVLSRRTTCG